MQKLKFCRVCNIDISERYHSAKVCFKCLDSNGIRTGGAKAQIQVYQAVKKGILPHISTLTCVDCGKPATVYEHRDYNKPLDVVPTCTSCNFKRGPAIYKNYTNQERRNNMITKKEAIEFAGSLGELAKILGISKAAISQWKDSPPKKRIFQMQSLHPEWFLFR